MKLWIDDFREAPDSSWLVVRKVEPAMKAIRQFRPDIISIDHDIENRPDDETFKPVAYFIGEMYNNDVFWADDLTITIHSDNPVGAKELQAIFNDYGILDTPWNPYTTDAAFKTKYGLT